MPGMFNMKNLNVLEKSKGVVIFANNTNTIDYLSIARRAERLINHYLNLPVTIIQNNPTTKNIRYNIDTGVYEPWNNSGRSLAYELSPYDQTILLDSDYLVFDKNLLKLLESVTDYKIMRSNRYIDDSSPDKMGTYSIPTLWATVIVFNKTSKSKMLFDFVSRIERNYGYYRRLYNIPTCNFRNDYAFTIADSVLNGYHQSIENYIPWPMLSVSKAIDSIDLVGNKFLIKSQGQGYVIPKQNIHILSKSFLLSDNCEHLIQKAIDA